MCLYICACVRAGVCVLQDDMVLQSAGLNVRGPFSKQHALAGFAPYVCIHIHDQMIISCSQAATDFMIRNGNNHYI